ncbi:ECF transporter S component [Alkalibacter saccharofermentans]|uniref:Riboflavin transporter n=1 Tax=Alkalibacter saccharofermentans DSM 14828 TaxID=1120975 RepID=A0A1M4VCZ7_9FIRM|nr:ECF transporter S component [Alkalibacter saccharofermentans]SHE66874.1 Riboflavin transporter FmnP [Alkalibacter saccharofermentans DSM 14828]
MQNSKTKFLTRVGVLSTIAFALMYLEFSVPLFPAFLKFDLSDVPALLGGFALGPLAGTIIELIKNLLFLLIKGTMTGGVGELANFVIGTAWVVPAAIIYRKNKTKKNAIKALVVGAVSMVVAAALLNYFIMLPLYAKIMPIEAIIAMGSAVNPNIVSFETLVLFGITPFNIFKTSIVSVVTALMYKKVSPVLHK